MKSNIKVYSCYRHVPSKKFDAIYKHGIDKQSCAFLCHARPSPAWVWSTVWKKKNNKKHVYVCVADRAGEPALSIGPSSV